MQTTMNFILLSFHVKDVGVDGLTQVALKSDDRLTEFKDLMLYVGAEEGFYLSTCNRTEFLFGFQDHINPKVYDLFETPHKYLTTRDSIIEHLLSVTLSMDSVVFGESQILGQFKRAYEQALEADICGPELSPLLNSVIREAKFIRTKSGLSHCHTSVSTVAGFKILEKLGLAHKRILFVGSGETNLILARYLSKREDVHFIWSSRGQQRAVLASEQYGGEVLNWDLVLKGLLPQVDVICVATHSSEILIEEVGLLNSHPRMVVDLAVPANASFEACERLGVLYYGIDTLNEELSHSQQASEIMMEQLQNDVKGSLKKIESELILRDSRGLFAKTVQDTEQIWEKELHEVLNHKLASLSEDQKQVLIDWSRKLVKKVNHVQLENLKSNV